MGPVTRGDRYHSRNTASPVDLSNRFPLLIFRDWRVNVTLRVRLRSERARIRLRPVGSADRRPSQVIPTGSVPQGLRSRAWTDGRRLSSHASGPAGGGEATSPLATGPSVPRITSSRSYVSLLRSLPLFPLLLPREED